MRERVETRENIDSDGYWRSRPGRPKTVCYSPRKTAKTGSDGEAGQVGREAAERCAMLWKRVQTGRNQWKRVETSIRMGTGKVGKSCSRTPRKPESGGESAGNRAEWARTRREREQGCGNVSKRAGTNGNVWKQRFGWVPGKSVSRVHGRPENPRPVASRPGTGGKVSKQRFGWVP